MKTTKIDWCDSTINPVVGCRNGCRYCYARKLNDRFNFIKNWKEPQFFPERLKQLNSKTPKSIFMDSMSDIDYWEKDWVIKTFDAIMKNPKHQYIFLTKFLRKDKNNSGVQTLVELRNRLSVYKNIFIGKTITNNNQYRYEEKWDFLSIEPLLEPIYFTPNKHLDQVIIGAETGNSPSKVIPEKRVGRPYLKICDEYGVKVFMKSSLKEIMGKDFRQDTLIWNDDILPFEDRGLL